MSGKSKKTNLLSSSERTLLFYNYHKYDLFFTSVRSGLHFVHVELSVDPDKNGPPEYN